jgi:hypothetical protein
MAEGEGPRPAPGADAKSHALLEERKPELLALLLTNRRAGTGRELT